MDLNNRKGLKSLARQRLEASESAPRIALYYAGIVALVTLLSTTVSFVIELQVDNFGGLSNLGMRSMLSTVQSVLPMVANIFLMTLTLGFVGTMLRVSRGQYASPRGMKIGFDRFWVLIRASLLQALLYLTVCILGSQIGFSIYLMTPLSRGLSELLVSVGTLADPNALMMDAALQGSLISAVLPMLLLSFLFCLVLMIPLTYRYRMVNYILLDRPGIGAFRAMRESGMMMRRNYRKLFLLDLSLWWYYAAGIAATLVCYGDLLLGLLGVALPFSPNVAFFVFFLLYLVINTAVTLFLRPYVEVIYAQVYEAIRPREASGGAVLGNIFQM